VFLGRKISTVHLKKNKKELVPSRVSFRILRENIRMRAMRAILKESTANHISLESPTNANFGKNMNCHPFQLHKRELQK